MKELQDMTLQELWELFPIDIKPHSDAYAAQFDAEKARLLKVCEDFAVRVSHVGSTALPIAAKPIVDILLQGKRENFDDLHRALASDGWQCMSVSAERRSYNKGYTPLGFADRVFHLHLREFGDCDEIFFRDYLLAHPEIAKEYEALKYSLLPLYRHDRDGYTAAKGAFVRKYTEIAKKDR